MLAAMKDGGAPVVLFAVSGGAFAEGVDYPGEMLQAVVVVSPALPMVRFEQERMRRYFEERFERGFEYAYVVPGMTRVVQSAGRLIRSGTDTGVVVLACRRFLQAPYSRYLPADWYLDDPGELACIDVGERTRGVLRKGEERGASRDIAARVADETLRSAAQLPPNAATDNSGFSISSRRTLRTPRREGRPR